MKVLTRSPGSSLDYLFNWTNWLKGDTISEVSFTTTNGLVASNPTISDGKVLVTISDGDLDKETGTVVCKITTATGRKESRGVFFYNQQR